MADLDYSPGLLGKISDVIGAQEQAIRLLVSILLGFPVAFIHRYFFYGTNPHQQHLFFVISGLLLGFWNFQFTIIHSFIALCFTFSTFYVVGCNGLSVIITFIFNMGYLLTGYYTTSTQNYDITWTMPHCVLTLRLIGLAFNLWDGQKKEEKLSVTQKETALKEIPSFLEVAAFAYFPGSFLIGPQFSYKRYLNYVQGQLAERENHTNIITLPDCIMPGLKRACFGLLYLTFFQLGTLYVPDDYFLTEEYLQKNFVQRCFLIGIWGRINLYKYISVWLLAEGVCVAFGLTYNGLNSRNQAKWDGCANVKLWTFENATTFGQYISAFNINTNNWCAEYIYKRLRFLGSKLYSQLGTLLFLAVWHGFHSGYYLCFLMEFLIMYLEKDIGPVLEKNEHLQMILKTRIEAKILVWIFLKIYTLVFMGYSLIPFVFLAYPRYTQVYGSIYYCGHIIFLSYPLLAPYIKRYIRGPKTQRSHQE